MEAKKIESLLTKLGLSKVRIRRQWVDAACPFTSRHGGGKDEHPSFGVRIAPSRSSYYRCQGGSCNAKGSLLELVWRLHSMRSFSEPERFARMGEWIVQHDFGLKDSQYREERPRSPRTSLNTKPPATYPFTMTPRVAPPEGKVAPLVAEIPEPEVIPDEHLVPLRTLSAEALEYLQGPKRRLLPATIAAWELGYGAGRISIPIRDYKQRLVGISGRVLDGFGPKFLHSTGFRRDYFLYGESKARTGVPVHVVEGFFDVIGLWQAGYNAVAIMGSYPSRFQVEKLCKFFTEVVVVPDGDDAGREMSLKVIEAVRAYMPVRAVPMLPGKDPDDLSEAEKLDLLGPPSHCDLVAV